MLGYVLAAPIVNDGFVPSVYSPSSCKVSTGRVALCMKTSLHAARGEVVKILARDLARQYEAPRDLDFSIFDNNVTFDDPTTRLNGKLSYRGMILTIGLVIIPFLFKNDAVFELKECELTEDGDKVRTTFATRGTTKWGSEVIISGEDFFWFGERSSSIVRHQSTWDQSPEELINSLRGPTLRGIF